MPNPLTYIITRTDVLAALEAFDGVAAHRFADSTGYDVLFKGRRYPPKAIVGSHPADALQEIAGQTA